MVATSRYNVIIVLFAALGALTYGYAFSVFSTSIGQPGFFAYFDLDPADDYTTDILGAINALFSFGAAVGALSIGWLPDWLGRKWSIIIAAAISLVGGALVAGSANIPMLVVVRLLHGVGVGQCITITPLYLSEVSSPRRRGLLAGMNAGFLTTGYFLSAWIGCTSTVLRLRSFPEATDMGRYGTYFATNQTFQWRFPLALSCLFPAILLIGSPWLPESPRWLLWKDRADEAWTITERLHFDAADEGQTAAREEFQQMKLQMDYERTLNTSLLHMFRTPSLRKRVLLGCGVLLGGQACGPLVVNNYSVIIYQSLGMTGHMPLLMYAIYVVVGSIVNYIAAFCMDPVGRRPLFLIGFIGTTVTMSIMTAMVALYAGTTNTAGNAIAILCLFVFVTFYGLCIDNTAFVYCAEIFPTTYRAKGVALGLFVYYASSIAFLTPAPTAMANIGWRFYLVFVSCSFVAAILTYFFVPETARLSLEEINQVFGDRTMIHMAKTPEEVKRDSDEKARSRNVTRIEQL